MPCMHTRSIDGPELDLPVLDYVLLIALVLACLAPMLMLR